jgi:uracil-DNA glycosylase
MRRKSSASSSNLPRISSAKSVTGLKETARGCRACDLWEGATQTVFGEGSVQAKVMLVGEQPGDKEDLAGHPFVGPAGKVLDKALKSAGISRENVYVTNIVKHFKSVQRGKWRIHKRPNAEEMSACRPWLDAEIALIRPKIVVCLGSSAAKALIGRNFKVTEKRGKLLKSDIADYITATVHPSSILRAPDSDSRRVAMKEFTKDLCLIAGHLPASALIAAKTRPAKSLVREA